MIVLTASGDSPGTSRDRRKEGASREQEKGESPSKRGGGEDLTSKTGRKRRESDTCDHITKRKKLRHLSRQTAARKKVDSYYIEGKSKSG